MLRSPMFHAVDPVTCTEYVPSADRQAKKPP
jgi:hypothetical protein